MLLDDVQKDPFGDHFSFSVTRRRELTAHPDSGTILRLSIDTRIGGRLFERFVVDLVAAAPSNPFTPDTIEIGHLLAFADMPIVELPVIDLRTHWSEKLSAYLRRYDDRPNTRVKDLVDLVLLIEPGLEPDADLYSAVRSTFAQREQPLPSGELPSMAGAWTEPFAVMAGEVELNIRTASGAHDLVQSFWRTARTAAPR